MPSTDSDLPSTLQKPSNPSDASTAEPDNKPKLSPDEVEEYVKQANTEKEAGNQLFKSKDYEAAIERYKTALSLCPEERVEERAIYNGNIAACYLQQLKYKQSVEYSTQSLTLNPTYTKALHRRALASSRLNTSTSLNTALEDYKQILKDDPGNVEARRAVRELPGRIERVQEEEKAEMLAKLKDLGNSFLGKFGLSTDMFKVQQDPNDSKVNNTWMLGLIGIAEITPTLNISTTDSFIHFLGDGSKWTSMKLVDEPAGNVTFKTATITYVDGNFSCTLNATFSPVNATDGV
ncbi:hypothetical protein HK102_006062, partial [Quaeritorhiza haematococci]